MRPVPCARERQSLLALGGGGSRAIGSTPEGGKQAVYDGVIRFIILELCTHPVYREPTNRIGVLIGTFSFAIGDK